MTELDRTESTTEVTRATRDHKLEPPTGGGERARRSSGAPQKPRPKPLVQLTVNPGGRVVALRRGETVADALWRAGVVTDSPCGGQGVCGKCRVTVQPASACPATPHADLTDDETRRGVRLACQLRPTRSLAIELDQAAAPVDPVTTVEVNDAVGAPPLPKSVGAAATAERSAVTTATTGLAIDLGTTTLEASLVRLRDGAELACARVVNPQSALGQDVVSRIAHASTAEGLGELSAAVREALAGLIDDLCHRTGTRSEQIEDVVVGGNPTMLQLAAAIDPTPLGSVPFEVSIESGCAMPPERFGLQLGAGASLYVPPVVHAYVGADIAAGLTAVDGFFERDEPVLFIDVGTNGELVLRHEGRCLATSAAAGPAFEGMGLRCGMRAEPGAVDAVEIAADGDVRVHTVDEVPATGLCGSGVVDLLAALLRLGVIEPTGRMVRPGTLSNGSAVLGARLVELDGMAAFTVADGVHFTQQDVREVQLAKSAIRTAVDMLLEHAGGGLPQRIIVAGAFGEALSAAGFEAIGMLPAGTGRAVRFVGNTSVAGCARLLRDAVLRDQLDRRMAAVEHVPLAEQPDFMDRFVANMELPEPS